MVNNLLTTESVLEWVRQNAPCDADEDTETAAYLAECVRLRVAFDAWGECPHEPSTCAQDAEEREDDGFDEPCLTCILRVAQETKKKRVF